MWKREISEFGHEVKIIPPLYVKVYVKRQSYQVTHLGY